MKAQTLYEEYEKIKDEKQNKSENSTADLEYLKGWLDCAEFVLGEQENDNRK